MPKQNSAEDVFKRARERGSENNTEIINDEEVKENFSRERRITTVAP